MVMYFTYRWLGSGVCHQTSKDVLVTDLVDYMGIVGHRYRHFLHHLAAVCMKATVCEPGKKSARLRERENTGGRMESR